MPVVSNASPLIGLSAIGRLDLLRDQFGEIMIPAAVLAELRSDSGFHGADAIAQALDQGWLRAQPVRNTDLVRALMLELDEGEAQAIALALESDASVLLLDEHDGRAAVRAIGLTITGALGILLRAKKEGRIASMADAMQSLRQQLKSPAIQMAFA